MAETGEKEVLALALLTPILIEQLGVEEEVIIPTASLMDDLGADSLDLVELIMSLEEKIANEITKDDPTISQMKAGGMATISDEEAEKIVTVGDSVKAIAGKLP